MSSSGDIRLWDDGASRYAQHIGDGVDDSFYRRLSPFLWHHLGDVAQRRILDVGCGHGWLTQQLHLAGAHTAGVDGSQALLQRACQTYPGVPFAVHDLTIGLPRPLRSYHGVVAHMVLMDLPDLDPLIADIRESLTSDGVFVFSILHPCFFAQVPVEDGVTGERYRKTTGYLAHQRRWIETFGGHHHYHRPLSWYVDLMTRHHLAVVGMHEPPSLPSHLKPEIEWTEYERWFATIPTMLAIACKPTNT